MTEKHSLENEGHHGEVISGVVKWYSPSKGYGFLTYPDGKEDVFIHFSILELARITSLREGDSLRCEVTKGKNGLQARRILSLSPAPSSAGRLNAEMVTREFTGHVKWFSFTKGYGFIEADGGAGDIFIHASLLLNLGLSTLIPGTIVRGIATKNQRGLEATYLAILPLHPS